MNSLLGGRALERTLDESADERATIGGARMDILLCIDGGGRGGFGLRDGCLVDRAAIQDRFHLGEPPRPVADADDADMGIARLAALVLVVEDRGGRHREIAATTGEFLEPPAPP